MDTRWFTHVYFAYERHWPFHSENHHASNPPLYNWPLYHTPYPMPFGIFLHESIKSFLPLLGSSHCYNCFLVCCLLRYFWDSRMNRGLTMDIPQISINTFTFSPGLYGWLPSSWTFTMCYWRCSIYRTWIRDSWLVIQPIFAGPGWGVWSTQQPWGLVAFASPISHSWVPHPLCSPIPYRHLFCRPLSHAWCQWVSCLRIVVPWWVCHLSLVLRPMIWLRLW